ncbi:MAG: flagellin [Parvularculaceae bacterium]|nr:flagellin [Parvularculaceae bacterium]
MKTVGSPTLLSAQRFASASASLRRQSEAARIELTTGRLADLPAALGGRIGEASSLRVALDLIAVRRQGLAQADLIATVSQRALTEINDGARSIATEALAANGRRDDAALTTAARAARSRIEAAFSSLNVKVAGQFAFSGDATDRTALSSPDQLLSDVEAIYASAADAASLDAALDLYFNDPAGGFQTTIYRGGSGAAPTIEIADGERAVFSARADDAAVRDVLRGLAVIAAAGDAPPSSLRDGALSAAGAAALTGSDGLTALRAAIGVNERRAAEASVGLEDEETVLTEAYNGETARDPLDAATRLQALEAQLNASLLATSRLSQLTLANFLR